MPATLPNRYRRKEYCHRSLAVCGRGEAIGCHFLSQLGRENRSRVWPTYCGLLVLEGEGTYEDWTGCVHDLAPGAFAQHLPDRFHRIQRKEPTQWIECSISLGRGLFERLADMGAIDRDRPVLYPGMRLPLIETFHRIQCDLRQARQRDLRQILARIHALLVEIRDAEAEQAPADPVAALVESAAEALRRDLHRQLDFAELANRHHVSYPHLRRLFRQRTGRSMAHFRLDHRMAQARMALQEGALPVKTIAALVGYADPFTFSRQFKKWTGESPRAFQARHIRGTSAPGR